MVHIEVPFSPLFEGKEVNHLEMVDLLLLLLMVFIVKGRRSLNRSIHHKLEVVIDPEFVNLVSGPFTNFSEAHNCSF